MLAQDKRGNYSFLKGISAGGVVPFSHYGRIFVSTSRMFLPAYPLPDLWANHRPLGET